MMMRTFLCLLFLACSQVSSKMPTKEELCNTVVDLEYQHECLECFTEAGPLAVYPEEVRSCVATYLPPVLAECSIPHHERKYSKGKDNIVSTRIQQEKPQHHHNHTNANLLPNCLKRGLKDLSRYLHKENLFTKQAGHIVKTVVSSKLIPNGGPNMLSITSLCYLLQDPAIQELVEIGASSCLQEYNNTCTPYASGRRLESSFDAGDLNEDFDEDDKGVDSVLEKASETKGSDEDSGANIDEEGEGLQGFLKFLAPSSSLEEEEEEEVVEEGGEEAALRKKRPTKGNGLPYGGTGALAEDMMFGTCIVESLIENGLGLSLINIISNEDFFYPIPSMWVEPLLKFYKEARENLENGEI